MRPALAGVLAITAALVVFCPSDAGSSTSRAPDNGAGNGISVTPRSPNPLCRFPTHPCGRICIAKSQKCLPCPTGQWVCNGHCIPDRIDCLVGP
jgi:hypothetical protein